MADKTIMGTSLEVLAPYLPYGIEVRYLLDEKDYKLDALTAGGRVVIDCFQDGEGWVDLHQEADYFSPILRPFSALCEPLPDSTVPAVEVARLALGPLASRGDFTRATCAKDGEKWHVRIPLGGNWSGRPLSVWVLPNGTADTSGALPDAAAIVDYLRRQGFALPVNGRPLLEGVDFIAKTSASAPTIESTSL